MLTVKEFAGLCNCNAQTLRYYDRIGLLNPVRVDSQTGYRYYSSSQALDFIKIKNLQLAGFRIEEIKSLLNQTDAEVYAAFEQKIAEQQDKLKQILKIQQTYLSEKKEMEKIIHGLSNYLMEQISDFEILTEFGLNSADGELLMTKLQKYLEKNLASGINPNKEVTLTVNEDTFSGTENIMNRLNALLPEDQNKTIFLANEEQSGENTFHGNSFADDFEIVFERNGWTHVADFIDSIPSPESGREYCFFFELTEQKLCQDVSFALFMIGAILLKKEVSDALLSCDVNESRDGENHFKCFRRK